MMKKLLDNYDKERKLLIALMNHHTTKSISLTELDMDLIRDKLHEYIKSKTDLKNATAKDFVNNKSQLNKIQIRGKSVACEQPNCSTAVHKNRINRLL
jgi:hypothetical protein